MNRRQKKKQYKKMHGCNPIKRPDGRYIFNLQVAEEYANQYGMDETLQASIDMYGTENFENIKTAMLQMADALRNMVSNAAECLGKAFMNYAETLRQETPAQLTTKMDAPVVVAEALGKRRRERCATKRCRASRR